MIHSTAVIDEGARLADDVEVGPYAVIDADVTIAPGCRIGAHAVITGKTTIGENTRIFQFASIGDEPQDKKYGGEESSLSIGRDNTIREYVTINRGTAEGGGETRLGDGNWIMAYAHIAHDCQVGSHCVLANGATLARIILHGGAVAADAQHRGA